MPRIHCDKKKCSSCLACVVACIDQHYDGNQADAVSCRIFEKECSPNSDWMHYVTRSCLHCENALCMAACPADALYRDERGFVIPVHDNCIGCRACEKACPFDVPRFGSDGKLVKCDGCSTRIACGLEPACVSICNTGALKVK